VLFLIRTRFRHGATHHALLRLELCLGQVFVQLKLPPRRVIAGRPLALNLVLAAPPIADVAWQSDIRDLSTCSIHLRHMDRECTRPSFN